jgi:hypothetical protein
VQTIKNVKVNENQLAVYTVIRDFGPLPDHALVPIAQHVLNTPQSSSGIRTRRKELLDLGLVEPNGVTRTGANRTATIFTVS